MLLVIVVLLLELVLGTHTGTVPYADVCIDIGTDGTDGTDGHIGLALTWAMTHFSDPSQNQPILASRAAVKLVVEISQWEHCANLHPGCVVCT